MGKISLGQAIEKLGRDARLRTSHVSLFTAIWSVSPLRDGHQVKVSRRTLMSLSMIRSTSTYHCCIRELVLYGYIRYFPSYHPTEASRITLGRLLVSLTPKG